MPRVLWRDERDKFLAALNNVTRHKERRRAEMLLLLDTGCRVAELAALDTTDYDSVRSCVFLNNCKVPDSPKREVPLHSRTKRALNIWLRKRGKQDTTALFISQKGNRLSVRQLQGDYELVCGLAGIESQGVHTLRHTSATMRLDDHTLDIHQVSRRLGHRSIMTTYKYYVHGSVEQEAHAIQRSRL